MALFVERGPLGHRGKRPWTYNWPWKCPKKRRVVISKVHLGEAAATAALHGAFKSEEAVTLLTVLSQ